MTQIDQADLPPCKVCGEPFNGVDGRTYNRTTWCYAGCVSCGYQTEYCESPAKARLGWNTRPAPPPAILSDAMREADKTGVLADRVRELEKTLRFYANPEAWTRWYSAPGEERRHFPCDALVDHGWQARKALATSDSIRENHVAAGSVIP